MAKSDAIEYLQRNSDKLEGSERIKILEMISKALGMEIDMNLLTNSDISDEQKNAYFQKINKEIKEAWLIETSTVLGFSLLYNMVEGFFEQHLDQAAHINSLKAAIEIYLIKSKTGQLPQKTPTYLPKDPYSGQNFEYVITDDGFILRCRGVKNIRKKTQEFELFGFEL